MPNSRLIDGQFAVGDPCWFDLPTDDPGRATEFYSRVFGWNFEPASEALGEESAAYQLATIGERKVAGIGQVVSSLVRPTGWWVHFAAPDIKSLVKRIREAGGQADDPLEVQGEGQMAIAHDPQGAGFGLWNPATLRSPALTETPGTVHWTELHARDPRGVAGFYEQLFGVEAVSVQAKEGDEPGATLNLQRTELGQPRMVAGVVPLDGDNPGASEPFWRLYFLVDDVDATRRSAEEAGGAIAVAQHDAMSRKVLVVDDGLGASFGVVQRGPGSRG